MAGKKKFRLTIEFYVDTNRSAIGIFNQIHSIASSEIENALHSTFDEDVDIEGTNLEEVPA